MKNVLITLIFFSFSFIYSYEFELSICSIFKDEERFLKEWIEYHKLIGVEHFYLYNHNSKDNYKEILEPYINCGLVELFDWNYIPSKELKWTNIQMLAYADALKRCEKLTKWLAIIDLDELICPKEKDSLVDFLKEYEEFSGVRINWQMFGTSFVKKVPNDCLMIESLFLKANPKYSRNKQVKSIIKPEKVEKIGIHASKYKEGYAVDPNKNKKTTTAQDIVIDKIQINHYWCRDEDFFYNVKIPRTKENPGVIWGDGLEMALMLNKVEDKTIFKFVGRLREAMGMPPRVLEGAQTE